MSCMSLSTLGARLHLTPQHTCCVATPHTHISAFTLPAASDTGGDISQSGWHGEPPITQSGHTGWPPHPSGSVGCVCVTAGSSGVAPILMARGHHLPTMSDLPIASSFSVTSSICQSQKYLLEEKCIKRHKPDNMFE